MGEIRVLSRSEESLHLDVDLMKATGNENDDPEENERYFEGDFWIDSDKVNHDGVILYWNYIRRPEISFVLLDFDPIEYPEHLNVILLWVKRNDLPGGNPFEYDMCDNTWEKFGSAATAIAYRGGSEYSYGIHVFDGDMALLETRIPT